MEIENKVEALLGKMTLEEKLGQMNQLSPWDFNELAGKVRKGEVGSILNYTDSALVNKIQRVAVEESRLGIPLLVSRDVIHGYKTIFPIPLGQAATFNPQIVERGARVAAVEASADGIRWTFAPMIDISRDPRWGRIAESCGEDPYLTSVMGTAMIKGFQGSSLNSPTSWQHVQSTLWLMALPKAVRIIILRLFPKECCVMCIFPFQGRSRCGMCHFHDFVQ